MPSHSNSHTVVFVSTVAVACALVLASATTLLQPRQEYNRNLDRHRNVLKALGELPEGADADAVEELFARRVTTVVVDHQGAEVDGADAAAIDLEIELKKADSAARRLPLYILGDGSSAEAYAIPIVGKGLWGTIYGYFALEADCTTIRGITFYKHQETPGLGALIEEDAFRSNFVGKTIRDAEGTLEPPRIVKGRAADITADPARLTHLVDGISGATLTCKSVNAFLADNLKTYEPAFARLRKDP